jgi:outer membrane receptor protein involved in Fe transport
MRRSLTFRPPALILCLSLLAGVSLSGPVSSPCAQEAETQEKKEEKKNQIRITEEILVVGEAPRDLPVSTVTTLDFTRIERSKPLDLAEAVSRAPGVFVTFGNKSEYTLKLRGMDSRRIALLLDGIPVYEPYFSTFDLKTVAASGVETIQVTKGPSSVLYGSNTLGGIVNVITRRPQGRPELNLQLSCGNRNTRSVGADGAWQSGAFALTGNVIHQDSGGFAYAAQEGGRRARENSDYRRTNLNLKAYYNPSGRTEILLNAGLYLSSYGLPPEMGAARPRFWRFKNWDRYSFNLGGFTAVGEDSLLRFRAYAVQYDNTLDAFSDGEMTSLRFRSTYDNTVYGLFALGDFSLGESNRLKASLNLKGARGPSPLPLRITGS